MWRIGEDNTVFNGFVNLLTLLCPLLILKELLDNSFHIYTGAVVQLFPQ